MSLKFRPLKAEEIEVRVARCTAKGAQFLLYKDARCDQNILDETVGPMEWQRRHSENKGNLFCAVGIRDRETGEWVWKEDCGAESNTEKQKGEASDSFKRACFNWGIGRELYSSPFIWVGGITREVEKGGRKVYELSDPFDRLRVSAIETDPDTKKILALEIWGKAGRVFEWSKEYVCCRCGKAIKKELYDKSIEANGRPYCSGTCRDAGQGGAA